jgi:hypothetical protein
MKTKGNYIIWRIYNYTYLIKKYLSFFVLPYFPVVFLLIKNSSEINILVIQFLNNENTKHTLEDIFILMHSLLNICALFEFDR